jgi:outer membrane protein insertion porin family
LPHRRSRVLAATALAVAAIAASLPGRGRAQEGFVAELKTVAAVKLEGRRRVSASELRAVLKTRSSGRWPWSDRVPLRLDFLRADTASITAVYRRHGHLDAEVGFRIEPRRDPTGARVVFTIREGPRSDIRSVGFAGVTAYPEAELRKRIYARPGRAFNPTYMIVDTNRIAAAYQDRGYLPRVVGSASRESLAVDVRYEVHEGRLYHFGDTRVSTLGERRVAERFVVRELLIRPGDVYRLPRIERSIERLYESGLFSQVQVSPEADSGTGRVHVDLRVRERSPRWVDLGVGSGTAERFRATVEWGNRNLARRALQGSVAGRSAWDANGDFLLGRGEVSLLEPWLFRARTRGLLNGFAEWRVNREDTRWDIRQRFRGGGFSMARQLGRTARVTLAQDNVWVRQSLEYRDLTVPAATRDSIESVAVPRYTTHRLRLVAERDLRDSPFLTTRGSIQTVTGEVAGGPLRGTSSFSKAEFVSSWYSPFKNGWVLAARVRAGAIDPIGDPPQFTPTPGVDPQVARVPLEDRFRTGGVNSIRGYADHSIPATGGLAVLQGNLELRVPLVGPLGLELYADAGNVWPRWEQIRASSFAPSLGHDALDDDDVRYVFGVGPRLDLPIGPVRLDFTWSLRPTRDRATLVAEPQFAIGPSF